MILTDQLVNAFSGSHNTNAASNNADAWYLDGFNPSSNPEMWQSTLLIKWSNILNQTPRLSTFTLQVL